MVPVFPRQRRATAIATEHEELLDYRRHVAGMYARVRHSKQDARARLAEFRRERDELFRYHPQSPLSERHRASFEGFAYYPYDPGLRYTLPVETDVETDTLELELSEDGTTRLHRFGRVGFTLGGDEVSLSVFWIGGYGGGRYVLDTIKHADLGAENGHLVVDFNYAYNPSCAYNPRWDCPLPPG